jgi:CO/xanthine dehydrogenase Mo-binding subunit
MSAREDNLKLGRREFLQRSGVLLIAAGGATLLRLPQAFAQQSATTVAAVVRDLAPEALDTWITIDTAGAVTAFFGKMDMGQGVDTAIAQIVAEELDVAVARVSVVMGDTHRTPNQGGASGSSACRQGAIALRNAAAEARRVLLERAAVALRVAPAALTISDGRVSVVAEPARATTYAELIADGFRTPLQWNRQYGNGLTVRGAAPVKAPASYKVVGTAVPRKDIAGKVLATTEYCVHVNLPGMLHARVLRPSVAGAVPASVDEASIAGIDGAQVVRDGDFLAVVAPTEWQAVRAARELKVNWSKVAAPFPAQAALFDHIRSAPVAADNAVANFGARQAYDPAPVLAAISAAPKHVEAEYEVAFQSHARMAPSIGVADVGDTSAVIYADTQKPHDTRNGIAKLLGLPPDQVRVIWKPGAGSYGRSDSDEAAFEAALLSQTLGKPVRVQWMRHEGHGWDPKAPAAVLTCKAGVAADGSVAAWYFRARGFSGWDVYFNAGDPRDTLVGQLTDWPKGDQHNFGVPGESYVFPNSVKYWETIPTLLNRASPLRTSHMRAPQELQLHFAHESFIDEVAVAAGLDPIALRLQYLKDPRERAVLEAVARSSEWKPRGKRGTPAKAAQRGRSAVLRGRGVSLNSGFGGYVATVCEVEVDTRSGRIWPRRFWVAHDCGIVLNPRSLKTTIEGNIVQGCSRALFEEVRFDERNVTSVDWAGYPILEMQDAPERIDITTLDRRDQPAGGAGEPAHVTVPAAIANAVFDATGIRLRRMPMTAARMREALQA